MADPDNDEEAEIAAVQMMKEMGYIWDGTTWMWIHGRPPPEIYHTTVYDAALYSTALELAKNRGYETVADLIAGYDEDHKDAERGRTLARAFYPVLQALRPLVLNFERVNDLTKP